MERRSLLCLGIAALFAVPVKLFSQKSSKPAEKKTKHEGPMTKRILQFMKTTAVEKQDEYEENKEAVNWNLCQIGLGEEQYKQLLKETGAMEFEVWGTMQFSFYGTKIKDDSFYKGLHDECHAHFRGHNSRTNRPNYTLDKCVI